MLIYVDDITERGLIQVWLLVLPTYLEKNFLLNYLGKLHYFLGVEVIYQNNGLLLNQTRYVITLVDREDTTHWLAKSTPLQPYHNLH